MARGVWALLTVCAALCACADDPSAPSSAPPSAQPSAQPSAPARAEGSERALEAEWGRVTAIAFLTPHALDAPHAVAEPAEVTLGHEGGWITRWRLTAPNTAPNTAPSLALLSAWQAHDGAVRALRDPREVRGSAPTSAAVARLWSLGADGSWAWWGLNDEPLARERAPELKVNDARPDAEGGWLTASDRGVVARLRRSRARAQGSEQGSEQGSAQGSAPPTPARVERLWRTAGEHRRAAFAVALDGDSLLSVGSDGWLRRWARADGAPLGARAAHAGWATALLPVVTPGGERAWLTGGSDGAVRLWSAGVSQGLTEAPPPPGAQGHPSDLTRLAVEWPWAVSGGAAGRVALYRLSASPLSLSLEGHLPLPLASTRATPPVLALALHGPAAYVGGGEGVWLWVCPLGLSDARAHERGELACSPAPRAHTQETGSSPQDEPPPPR